MSNAQSSVRFSPSLGLSFLFLSFFLILIFGGLFPDDTAKQMFLLITGGFLALAILLKLGATLRFDAMHRPDLVASILTRKEIYIALSLVPYTVICLLRPSPLNAVLYTAVIILCVSFWSSVRITQSFLTVFAGLLLIVAIIHCLIYFGQGMPTIFQSTFPQKNIFALNMLTVFFSCVFIISLSTDRSTKNTCFVTLGLCVGLVIASHSRGTLLDMMAFGAISFFWPFISRSKIRYWSVFVAIFVSGIILVPVYVLLSYSTLGRELNNIFQLYTGIGLFSGRNLVWPAYIYLISLHPILGYGFGDVIGNLMRMVGLPPGLLGLSAHNLYLMTASQTGVVGLAALILFFGTIWACLFDSRHSVAGSLAANVFLTMLVNEMFEVSFTQVSMYAILTAWSLIGFGIQPPAKRIEG